MNNSQNNAAPDDDEIKAKIDALNGSILFYLREAKRARCPKRLAEISNRINQLHRDCITWLQQLQNQGLE